MLGEKHASKPVYKTRLEASIKNTPRSQYKNVNLRFINLCQVLARIILTPCPYAPITGTDGPSLRAYHTNTMPLCPYHNADGPGFAPIILTPCPYAPITDAGRPELRAYHTNTMSLCPYHRILTALTTVPIILTPCPYAPTRMLTALVAYHTNTMSLCPYQDADGPGRLSY